MKFLFSYLLFFALPHLLDFTQSTTITGMATVIDGDTIEIRGQRIRLYGIDAPESSQQCNTENKQWPCGRRAAFALDAIVKGKNIKCIVKDTDRYGRSVCKCYEGTLDINGYMVRQGWAVAYRQYSLDYISQQEYAQVNKLGVWNSEFQMPWDYRKGTPKEAITGASQKNIPNVPKVTSKDQPTGVSVQTQPQAEQGPCLIKGNISSSGEKIYHPTDSPWYSKTKIDTSKGERWFCSQEEARHAGWKKANY